MNNWGPILDMGIPDSGYYWKMDYSNRR